MSDASSEAGEAEKIGTPRPVPVTRPQKDKSPQDIINEFWSLFTSKTPGKATSVIPQRAGNEKPVRRRPARILSGGRPTDASYEVAAAQCRAKVKQIVKECRRVNQKYRDPHFDLELDLALDRRDCLESLSNDRPSEGIGYGRGRWRRRQAKVAQAKEEAADTSAASTTDTDAPMFEPQSVKRVVDIFDKPQFYVDGPTANDVRQGRDGDCWLMAALCTLSNKAGLIEKVCVAQDAAVGVYGFVFHRDGAWFSEIIDDKLYLTRPDYDESLLERDLLHDRLRVDPEESYRKIYQSNSGALYFAQCANPNETWLPLLEKAYAKAHGDYAAVEGGFTGEGIEDLTGGVTSEIHTTDILDKEYFWTEELLKVNESFLFGCSTGMWGRGFGERGGIVEQHAYSVMRAVEMDGQRLVLLKNPWGSHEWKGAWSDGSKEWTAEWMQKLNHRFGDDGSFWISYDDLLRKYQAFDRTRLFGPDWKLASIWTSMTVPWTLEYNATKFAFVLARSGPVVLVLSQLDDRYFRGLEGQYTFDLSFRLHKVTESENESDSGSGSDSDVGSGSDGSQSSDDAFDYVVRGQAGYCMSRSVSVELELDAGQYLVLVKIDAVRYPSLLPPEDVVCANAKTRREKLIRIGLAYDVAHSKGQVVETPEEKRARLAAAERKTQREKTKLKKMLTEKKHLAYLSDKLAVKEKRKEIRKHRARKEAKKQKIEARQAKRTVAEETEEKTEEKEKIEKREETEEGKDKEMAEVSDAQGKDKGQEHHLSKRQLFLGLLGAAGVKGTGSPEKDAEEEKDSPKDAAPRKDSGESSSTDAHHGTPSASASRLSASPEVITETETREETREETSKETPEDQNAKTEAAARRPASRGRSLGPPSIRIAENDDVRERSRSRLSRAGSRPGSAHRHHDSGARGFLRSVLPIRTRRDQSDVRPPPSPPPSQPGSPAESDVESLSSLSEVDDDEVEFLYERNRLRDKYMDPSPPEEPEQPEQAPPPPPELPAQPAAADADDTDPWNAIAVIGLRVYYQKVAGDDERQTAKGEEDGIVTLRVERPLPTESDDSSDGDDEEEEEEEKEETGDNTGKTKKWLREEKVLDVDDSLRDATVAVHKESKRRK